MNSKHFVACALALLLSGCSGSDAVDDIKDIIGVDDTDLDVYLSAPSVVVERTAVSISALVSDDNQSNFSFQWAASEGKIADLTNASTTYTAPDTTTDKTITLSVQACGIPKDEEKVVCEKATKNILITPEGAVNRAPSIQSVSINGQTINEGSTIVISAIATDDDGDTLGWLWKASKGSFDDQTLEKPVYTAPNVGSDETVTIDVTVSDGAISNSLSVFFTVRDTSNPSENKSPSIQSVNIPSSMKDTDSVTLSVLALDPDQSSETLVYFWQATSGTLDSNNEASTKFTPDPKDTDQSVTVSVTVCDTYNQCDSRSSVIAVESTTQTPIANNAPEIKAVAVPESVNENSQTECTLLAVDTDGDALVYFWSASMGTFTNGDKIKSTYNAPQVETDIQATITVNACDSKGACDSEQKSVLIKNTPY